MRQIGLGTFEPTSEMFRLVDQVLRSGRLSYGPLSREFETRFAGMHGCKYGVLSNSGTSSLLVALQTLKELHGWKDGDEVIVPALTFVAGINIVIQNRLNPILVDIDDYCGINCDLIEQAITPKTRAIIPVHLFGQPCDIQLVNAIAKKHNLKVIEDSCEAAFATINSGSIDWWSDIGCHSFYMAHIITCGIGGMAVTNNLDYANKMRSLVNHALSYEHLSNSDAFDPMMLSRRFVFDSIGHSARITELESALGLAQLNDWQSIVRKRQYNFAYLMDALKPLEDDSLIRLLKLRDCMTFCPMMFPIVTLTQPKHGLMAYLTQHGIGVRDTLPLTNQPAYKGLFNEDDYPNAKFMNNHGLYTGVHQGLTADDLEYMVEKIGEYYE
jgi:dTDP-4-amino-4,6-dideoxygalactose transaminase